MERAAKVVERDRKCAEKEAEEVARQKKHDEKCEKKEAKEVARAAKRDRKRKWEEQYAEFERCVEMPARSSKLYIWQQNQLGNGPFGLNAMIQMEIAENEGSTHWSERRVRLVDCVAHLKSAKKNDK